jgi:uncharacterized protein (TIGR03032 family)
MTDRIEHSGFPQEADQGDTPNLSVTAGMRQWLLDQQLSLAFTSYQSGRLLTMGVDPSGNLAFNKQNYLRAMGLHYNRGTLHLAALFQIWRLENLLDPGQYANGAFDSVLVPRAAHTTGYVDAHDLAVDKAGRIIFVNTRFSCLATTDERFSFRPVWKPDFISALFAEDRCHLNGLAMEDGVPRYVTAVNTTDVKDGWRHKPRDGGVVIEVESKQIVASGLSMPHSPRVHDGALWVQDSGRGFLVRIDPATGTRDDVVFCPGFLRGMTIHNGFAIAALSQARHGHFGELALQKELDSRGVEAWCGLVVIDLKKGQILEFMRINSGFTELFDVAAMRGVRNPMSVGPGSEDILTTIRFNPNFAPLHPR